jgi:hypothetical protein
MRKIEEQMIQAIVKKKSWRNSNTEVVVNDSMFIAVNLYRTTILSTKRILGSDNWEMTVRNGGYTSVTTKSRLNALLHYFCPGTGIMQKDFEWYLVNHNSNSKTYFPGEFSFSTKIGN